MCELLALLKPCSQWNEMLCDLISLAGLLEMVVVFPLFRDGLWAII